MVTIWILLVYTLGVVLTHEALSTSLDFNDDPWVAMMWPLLLLALFIQWLNDLRG